MVITGVFAFGIGLGVAYLFGSWVPILFGSLLALFFFAFSFFGFFHSESLTIGPDGISRDNKVLSRTWSKFFSVEDIEFIAPRVGATAENGSSSKALSWSLEIKTKTEERHRTLVMLAGDKASADALAGKINSLLSKA